ncbi:MAG: c-type cytochrome [Gemmatimonadaceae bacterium]
MLKIGLVRITLGALTLFTLAACHHGAGASGATPKAAAAPAGPRLPAGVTLAMIPEGDSLFHARNCVRCHGQKAVGGANAPTLVKTAWDHGSGSYDDIVKTITSGVPKEQFKVPSRPNAMRPRGGSQPLLTDPQVNAIAAYVWSLNHPIN